jgi:hypothetical protein
MCIKPTDAEAEAEAEAEDDSPELHEDVLRMRVTGTGGAEGWHEVRGHNNNIPCVSQ